MTPRDVDAEVVETPALDELLNGDTVVIKDADIDARIALKDRARLELSRLKSRPTRQEVERAELRSLADTAASILRRHAEEEGFMDIDTQEWLMRYEELK